MLFVMDILLADQSVKRKSGRPLGSKNKLSRAESQTHTPSTRLVPYALSNAVILRGEIDEGEAGSSNVFDEDYIPAGWVYFRGSSAHVIMSLSHYKLSFFKPHVGLRLFVTSSRVESMCSFDK